MIGMAAPHRIGTLPGRWINLDASTQRRARMQAQLVRLGLDGLQRLSAVDGRSLPPPQGCGLTPAELGCLLSHLQALESLPAGTFGLVFEDDVDLSADLPALLQPDLLGGTRDLDLVLLDCQPACNSHVIAQLWHMAASHWQDAQARTLRSIALVDAAPVFRWGTPAYLVTPRGRDRLIRVLQQGLEAGPKLPVDLLLGQAMHQGTLAAAVAVPFLVAVRLDSHTASTIGDLPGARVQALASALRRMLFAGPVDDVARWVAPWLPSAHASMAPLELTAQLVAALFSLEAAQGHLDVGRRGTPPSGSGVQP